jgi:hypothetical protein
MKVRNTFQTWEEGIRQLANIINANDNGQTGTVTLTANAASTTLTDYRITASSVISLMPTTANAAGAIATTYIGTTAIGSATITHANNAQADKTFRYSIIG